MKREAEDYLLSKCDSLSASIVRPGLVYHERERPWSMPLGLISNLSHALTPPSTRLQGPPATNLKVLADVIIREALKRDTHSSGNGEAARHTIISATDMKTFPL